MKWKVYGLALVAFFIAPFIAVYALYRQYVMFCLNVAEEVLEDVKDRKRPNQT